jgi:hypothetical protein
MASAAQVMLLVPTGTTASTMQVAMDVREVRVVAARRESAACIREGPVRTAPRAAKDSAPWRRIT